MVKLLRSDFRRLWRSKLFYLGITAVAASVAFGLINNVHYKRIMLNLEIPIDNILFLGTLVIGFAIAIFTSFFVGTEYSDGTMRSKVVVGHNRSMIYLSHFLTTTFAAVFMMVIGTAVIVVVGIPWMGSFVTSCTILLPQILCCLLSIVALNAMILLLAMLIPSKAICAIVCLVLVMVMTNMISPTLWSKLEADPIIPEMSYTDSEGVVHTQPEQPNPHYATGTTRTILQLCYDMLPTAQMYQYGYDKIPKNIHLFPLYSVLFIGVLSTVGACAFRRRDLK
ncbi:MAG: ABC transporter permease subunit [Clostridia bacterium]|nr:ABC transporter permease subunit [Clostridia bacterium]